MGFIDAEGLRLCPGRLNFLALTNIGRKGDDLALIGFLQPSHNDGGIQSAGICQYDFVYRCHNFA